LNQLQIVAPYIEENEDYPENWIMKEHKRCFTNWLKDQTLPKR
jgi:hypothetical protein